MSTPSPPPDAEDLRGLARGQVLSFTARFSSTVEGNALTQDEQLAKLRLIVEVARDIWGG